MKQYGGQRWPELLFSTAGFEYLKHHKVGIFVEKSNSQRLKKSKKFAFRNSQFTSQHNISLSGAINKDKIVYISDQTSDQSSVWQPQSRTEKKKVRWNNGQQFLWTKKVVSRTATLLFDNACILNLKQNTNAIFTFCYKVLVLLRGFVFKSGSHLTRV